jgi:hypothetical protein
MLLEILRGITISIGRVGTNLVGISYEISDSNTSLTCSIACSTIFIHVDVINLVG